MQAQPPLFGQALELAAAAINRALALDPLSLARLRKLSGRCIAITATQPPLPLAMYVERDGVRLEAGGPGDADVHIRATAAALLRLATDPADRSRLFGQEIDVSGDTQLAGQLGAVFADLHVDWAGLLAPMTGDLAAQGIVKAAGDAARWLRRTMGSLRLDVEEFLEHESGMFPSTPECELQFREIERARDDTERLEARVRRLADRLKPTGT